MMATSVDDLIRIHVRFPFLAFLLSLSNPSSLSISISSPQKEYRTLHTRRSESLIQLLAAGIPSPFTRGNISIPLWVHDLFLHILASGCVAIVFYQTLILGLRGVVVYACWTWHNPFTWVSVGGLVHLLRVLSYRLCLGPTPDCPNQSKWDRLQFCLASTGSKLAVQHLKVERFFTLLFQVIGLMNYGYGTVMLSSMTLVGPTQALKIFTLIGFSAVTGRLIAIWLLEVFPDGPTDDGGYTAMDGMKMAPLEGLKHPNVTSIRD